MRVRVAHFDWLNLHAYDLSMFRSLSFARFACVLTSQSKGGIRWGMGACLRLSILYHGQSPHRKDTY